jgi:hypothetical protein
MSVVESINKKNHVMMRRAIRNHDGGGWNYDVSTLARHDFNGFSGGEVIAALRTHENN